MFARRGVRLIAAAVATVVLTATALVTVATSAGAAITVPNALQAIAPFSPGTFDSGQGVDVVVPAASGAAAGFTAGSAIFVLECAAPGGIDPTTTAQCDGNTNYGGGTITVNSDLSIDVTGGSSPSGLPYTMYALPDSVTLSEAGSAGATCGLGSANDCVVYIGEGGGSDTGMSLPHVFSQVFQVHRDPTDSGTLNPGDGTFPADAAPAITSTNSAGFVQGHSGTFTATATGYPPPTFSETGALPGGVTLNSTTGVLSGSATNFGSFPITLKASNGVSPAATQAFTLSVEPGVSGDQIANAAQALAPFSPGTFDSGQPIDAVVPPNAILTPGSHVFVMECGAPHGVLPTTTAACDGNTNYGGGTIFVASDGSVDLTNSTTGGSDIPYTMYALPDSLNLSETPSNIPKCAQGSANECVLYIGQGGGGDVGMTQPHVFSQAFQVHPDATDSGTQSPGDGTFPPDVAPAITSGNSANFVQGHSASFSVTGTGYPPPTFSRSGTLPGGVTLNSTTGALSGTATNFGTFPITITASNGVTPNATQAFTLHVAPGISGDVIPGAAAAQAPFSPGTFDSGQPIDVIVPPNPVLTPGAHLFVLECAAPKGQLPTTTASCDGNTNYGGGTITVNGDGSVDVTGGSSASGLPYTTYALPDTVSLSETISGFPRCGMGSINECVLYMGLGGGGDVGMTQPHFFSQPFQVHPDATDSGTVSPGDGTFGADVPPTITSGNSVTFTKGHLGSFTVTGTGYGPPTFTETGALPGGVTLNQYTGVLGGTPTAGGVFPITITASNGASPNATQAFTLTVNAPPAITSANNTTFTEGSPGSFNVTATGTPAPTFSETGALPTGVTLSTAGLLSGTPTQQGVFPITITATNGVAPDATQAFTLTVDAPPTITSANNTTFIDGLAGSFNVTATGTPAPTFSETGALPTGVTLSTAGLLSGTPTQFGSFPITITATNSVAPDATQAFTLTVDQNGVAPTITSANNATFNQGQAGTFTATATGTPAPTFSETGALPSGITLSSAGVLSGTTTQFGTFSITITASNGITPDAHQAFTLTVNQVFQIFTSSLPNATPGAAYGPVPLQALGTAPGATLKWKKAGLFPHGLKMLSTGLLQGTPSIKLVHGSSVPVPIQVTEKWVTITAGKKTKHQLTVMKTLTLHIN
jgi:hypothetical protein